MKIQFEVEDSVVSQFEELRTQTGSSDCKELFNNALALLAWAVRQRQAGRSIGSIDVQAKEYTTLQMPSLEYAAFIVERIANLNAA